MNRRHVLRRIAGCTAAVLSIGAVIATSVPAGATGGNGTPAAPKPTIVLVHGAWADSGSWDGVVRRLQHDDYTVVALPNPLQGLTYDSDTVAGFLSKLTGPIVLVGHSYGGAVITNAARDNANVKALVYIDAYLPDEGDTVVSLTTAASCFAVADLNTVFNFAPIPNAPAGDVDAYVKQDVFPRCFANGLSQAQGAKLAATQRPLATAALGEPSGVPAWKTIPSWAVIGTADHVIPVDAQRSMAARAHSTVTEIVAPHLSMISNPSVVTRVIERADKATAAT